MTTEANKAKLLGKRVELVRIDNEFAKQLVGKTGIVQSSAPLDMVSVALDDGTVDCWVRASNLRVIPG